MLRWDPELLRDNPKPSSIGDVFNLTTSKLTRVGPLAWALLQQAHGHTALAPILAGLEPSERQRVRRAVRRLTTLGLLS